MIAAYLVGPSYKSSNYSAMNKKELIRTISQELDPPMSQDKIALVLDKAVEITKRTLATGEPVKWSGFGSFVTKGMIIRKSLSCLFVNA